LGGRSSQISELVNMKTCESKQNENLKRTGIQSDYVIPCEEDQLDAIEKERVWFGSIRLKSPRTQGRIHDNRRFIGSKIAGKHRLEGKQPD
jgi:hypothetical protein